MNVSPKYIWCGLTVIIVLLTLLVGYFIRQILLIGTAYKAKILCSSVFVSGRDPNSILTQDLFVDDMKIFRYLDTDIDYHEKSVTATFMGMAKRKAIYRPLLGCTLLIGCSEEQLRSQFTCSPDYFLSERSDQIWPLGKRVQDELPFEIKGEKLHETLDEAFCEPDPNSLRRTRAVVIVYDGRIVAERYAQGFSYNTALIGWSMTKSVINALTGILVKEGKLSLHERTLIPEWTKPGDPRNSITLDQLLRMSSGLAFSEDYTNPLKDVIYMLLGTGDVMSYAAKKPLKNKPDSIWSYSSGTSNIISSILQRAVGGSYDDYFMFPRRALFHPLGMDSAVIEPDASGTLVGSSFMYASARDWARFGLLYVEDGIWNGKRLLPEGWVDYSRTPTPTAPNGEYGAHFWLDIPSFYRKDDTDTISLPSDSFHAIGHEGQFITIIPSRKLVIVRLGLTRLKGAWDHPKFVHKILEAIS